MKRTHETRREIWARLLPRLKAFFTREDYSNPAPAASLQSPAGAVLFFDLKGQGLEQIRIGETVCAWCGQRLNGATEFRSTGFGGLRGRCQISHGICAACKEEMVAQARALSGGGK